jgi:hypothetical protein
VLLGVPTWCISFFSFLSRVLQRRTISL